jgi:hypothetical protein
MSFFQFEYHSLYYECKIQDLLTNIRTYLTSRRIWNILSNIDMSSHEVMNPSIHGTTAHCWALAAFQFLIFYTVGRTPWMGVHSVSRPLATHRTTQIQNKLTRISMPRVGFEPTIPVFERGKTVHALERASTEIGRPRTYMTLKLETETVI